MTVSLTDQGCYNYAIAGFDCDLQGVGSLFADVVWNPIEYVDEIEADTNLLGEQIKFYHKKTGTLSFNAIVDEAMLDVLQDISMGHSATLRDNLPFTTTWQIYDFTVQITSSADVIVAAISFRVEGADAIINACCGSIYDGAPFEPCDPDGGTPPVPSECVDFIAGIGVALPVLTATSVGGPGGVASYQWFYDANNDGNFETLVSQTAQALNLVDPGTYRVQVVQGGCSGTSDFLYNDICAGWAIGLTFENGLLIAEPNFDVVSYDWYEPGDILDPSDIDNVYVPTQSGIHTVRVSTSACGTIEATLNVTLGESCGAFVYDLVRIDNVLEIQNLAGCTGTVTYQWQVDIGDGNGFTTISGAVGPTLTINDVGNYRSILDCDNPICQLVKDILVLDNCVQFKGWISGIVPIPGNVQFTAASSNAPAGTSVNYTWYEWISENWQLIGTGINLTIPDTADPANIKLIVTAGQCVREDFTHDCVDPSAIEPYQAFYADAPNQTEFTVLSFTFDQPYDQGGALTENQIGAKYLVVRNGLIQKHKPLVDMATTNEQNTYSYDWADNKLIFPTNNALFTGDRVSVADLQP